MNSIIKLRATNNPQKKVVPRDNLLDLYFRYDLLAVDGEFDDMLALAERVGEGGLSDGTAGGGVQLLGIANDLRCTELDDLVLTHYHNRDTYFIYSMAKRIRVKTLHLPHPNSREDQSIANQLAKEAERHGIAVVFGTENLAIDDLKIPAFEHQTMPHERHDALLFSAEVGGEVFTYINGSLPESSLVHRMHDAMNAADYVILGETGFSNTESTVIEHSWKVHKAVFVTEEKLLRFITDYKNTLNIKHVREPITFFVK